MNNFKQIEEKWQKYWEDNKCFTAITGSSKKPYYILVEFPYPCWTCKKLYCSRCQSKNEKNARI